MLKDSQKYGLYLLGDLHYDLRTRREHMRLVRCKKPSNQLGKNNLMSRGKLTLTLHYVRESSTHRAWQTLPRHLRRRAASHNVRRVPLRVREKARAEESIFKASHLCSRLIRPQMDPVKRKTHKTLPKRGKAKQITRTEALLRRQRKSKLRLPLLS